jgi:hypothetical protein
MDQPSSRQLGIKHSHEKKKKKKKSQEGAEDLTLFSFCDGRYLKKIGRYDARLLLSPPRASSTLSNLDPQITTPPHLSPTGYSDLPSDHEEMFYFEPHERLEIAQKYSLPPSVVNQVNDRG